MSRRADRDYLRNAERVAAENGLDRDLVIDADVHHLNVLKFLGPYLDNPWRREVEHAPFAAMKANTVGDRDLAGRVKRPPSPPFDDGRPPAAIAAIVDDMARFGIDYVVAFPGDLLDLGNTPQAGFEVAIARAYARWLTECVLPHEPRFKVMLYLPLDDAAACVSLIEEFGEAPGIVGALVTGKRPQHIHRPEYTPVYAALEERGLALGIHTGTGWWGEPWRVFNRFIGVHTLYFPTYNSVHMINLLMAGIPERFPRLRLIFFEAGAAIIPMLMARLDTAFLMRPSEAPLLRRRPSEYMREFYYTIQPIEQPEDPAALRTIFDQIGRSQILYASDYPHWDCDMPNSITNLGFLSAADRRAIFCDNAVRAFGLQREELTPSPRKLSAAVPAGARSTNGTGGR